MSMEYGSAQVKASDLPVIRRVLGCALRYLGSWAETEDTVRCRVAPTRFPGVIFFYDRKLPKNTKCKIVTTTECRRESRLLCEA